VLLPAGAPKWQSGAWLSGWVLHIGGGRAEHAMQTRLPHDTSYSCSLRCGLTSEDTDGAQAPEQPVDDGLACDRAQWWGSTWEGVGRRYNRCKACNRSSPQSLTGK
jgi:hypothetical protein